MLCNAQDASGCFASQFLQRRDGSKNCAACRENGTGVEHDRQLAHCVVPPAYISRGNPILYIFHYQELGSPIVGIVTPHYRAVHSTLPADMMRWTAPQEARGGVEWPLMTNHQRGPSMTTITTIGLDLAKKVFQVHGVDAEGVVVVARKLRRKEVLAFFAKLPPCLVGMEACG